jgi:hypothetical protein
MERVEATRRRVHHAPSLASSDGVAKWYCQKTIRTAFGCGGSGSEKSS